MLILKHLKTHQHVSIIIQIIFREFVSSLLKPQNLMWWCCRITTLNSVALTGNLRIPWRWSE